MTKELESLDTVKASYLPQVVKWFIENYRLCCYETRANSGFMINKTWQLERRETPDRSSEI